MNRSKIIYVISVLLIMIHVSCSNNHTEKIFADRPVNEKGYPVIKFDTTYHDFGTLIQGEQVSYTFRFKNTGTSSLIINDAFSTCGCTVPDFSKEPVLPGKDGKVEVVFNSEGKSGLQYKSVTLKLNTKIKEKTLVIKANVLENNYKS